MPKINRAVRKPTLTLTKRHPEIIFTEKPLPKMVPGRYTRKNAKKYG